MNEMDLRDLLPIERIRFDKPKYYLRGLSNGIVVHDTEEEAKQYREKEVERLYKEKRADYHRVRREYLCTVVATESVLDALARMHVEEEGQGAYGPKRKKKAGTRKKKVILYSLEYEADDFTVPALHKRLAAGKYCKIVLSLPRAIALKEAEPEADVVYHSTRDESIGLPTLKLFREITRKTSSVHLQVPDEVYDRMEQDEYFARQLRETLAQVLPICKTKAVTA